MPFAPSSLLFWVHMANEPSVFRCMATKSLTCVPHEGHAKVTRLLKSVLSVVNEFLAAVNWGLGIKVCMHACDFAVCDLH